MGGPLKEQQQRQPRRRCNVRQLLLKRRSAGLLLPLRLQLLVLLLQSTLMAMSAAQTEKVIPVAMEGAADDEGILGQRPAPVIGVLLQPLDENIPPEFAGASQQQQLAADETAYVAASYVKYIESAGCVALPIDLDLSEDEHKALFKQIDGLLLPGGSADLSTWDMPYIKTTKLYYELAKESNERGKFFPIFAICLGYEALVIVASGNINYFSQLFDDDLDRRRVLTFKSDADSSVLFGSGVFSEEMGTLGDFYNGRHDGMKGREGETMQQEMHTEPDSKNGGRDLATLRSTFSVDALRGLLATHPIAYFHHYRHLSAEEFNNDQVLKAEWHLLATARLPRENLREIVAAVEHKKYPFFGLQFHPEKALFEHCPQSRIPHFFLSILPSVYISAFLGLIARRSTNMFKDKKEKFDKVAFAFTPTRTALYGQFYSFEQVYLFPKTKREEMQQQMRRLRQQTQRQEGEERLADVTQEEA